MTMSLKNTGIHTTLKPIQFLLLTVLLSLVCAEGVSAQTNAQTKKAEIPRGYKLIDGDIQVPLSFSPEAFFQTNLWPNGIVPFEFDTNVTMANQTAMLAAMTVWQNVADVNFRPRNGEADYVHIQNSTGNNSAVGQQGGQQIINITSWGSQFIIAHELGHALGLLHEHSRTDRDSFVRINTANVQSGQGDQFTIVNGGVTYGPYDFDSVMHYDQCSFSIDCPAGATCNCTRETITVLPPNNTMWQTQIGQRSHLSRLDQLIMSFLYPQGNSRFVDQVNGCITCSGTFFAPNSSFIIGYGLTPPNGTLWIQPGNYSAVGMYNKAVTLRAPLGGVTLGK